MCILFEFSSWIKTNGSSVDGQTATAKNSIAEYYNFWLAVLVLGAYRDNCDKMISSHSYVDSLLTRLWAIAIRVVSASGNEDAD